MSDPAPEHIVVASGRSRKTSHNFIVVAYVEKQDSSIRWFVAAPLPEVPAGTTAPGAPVSYAPRQKLAIGGSPVLATKISGVIYSAQADGLADQIRLYYVTPEVSGKALVKEICLTANNNGHFGTDWAYGKFNDEIKDAVEPNSSLASVFVGNQLVVYFQTKGTKAITAAFTPPNAAGTITPLTLTPVWPSGKTWQSRVVIPGFSVA